MDKDPKKNLDQTNPKPDDNDTKSNNVTISSDDWNKMQSNMKHMSNTVNNLSTKLENVHKNNVAHAAHNSSSNNSSQNNKSDNNNYVSRDEFNKLTKQYQNLGKQFKQQNTHANVLKHAKDTLKQNGMHVSASTFNQLLGPDNRTTDEKIGWFKPIYKKVHARKPNFPHQTKHDPNKPNFGVELAKTDKTGPASHMNSLDMYMK